MATRKPRGTTEITGHIGLSALFGQQIRKRRLHLGFSQEELADRAHLDRTTVGRVERGEFRVTLEVAGAMAQACETSLWEMLRPAGNEV